ncbi:hypothetical protein BKA70DRAFT_569930 [Coprinopsis sp. MPI-PUGE-AT-0042]|nr:hypothetical protein BKA70DRAFT_569930 [Coprinopsis sp. MPI-PUGE-AT-0042]
MPRILKRLVEQVQKDASPTKYFPLANKSERPKSLHEPKAALLPRPTLRPAGYSKSILLDDPSTNIVTRSRIYSRHKSLPPRVNVPHNAQPRKGESDVAREMTEEERRWWTNPYLRMLSTPPRLCFETDQYLPTDLLVRIGTLQLPADPATGRKASVVLVPDGLLHTKFTGKKSGRSFHVLCLREAVDRVMSSGKYRRMIKDSAVTTNSQICNHVAHHLRLRVLQELDLLCDQLREVNKGRLLGTTFVPLIRRLSLEEFEAIKSTGILPFENALAVIELPPVEPNPVTGEEPKPSMAASPPPMEERYPQNNTSPVSTFLSEASSTSSFPSRLVPTSRIPFYNGVSAFPFASQRAALHELLVRMAALEGKWREASLKRQSQQMKPSRSTEEIESNAFVLCADSNNLKRADIAAVAIALWRLRMFEGGGWSESDPRWSLGTNRDVHNLL